MVSVLNSGTHTPSGPGEETLATYTAAAHVAVLAVDLGLMVAGDRVVIRVYTKILTGSSERLVYEAVFQNAQTQKNVYTVPVPSMFHTKVTLAQPAGGGHAYEWSLMGL